LIAERVLERLGRALEVPRTVMGAPSFAKPLLMAWVACDSDTPSGRLKETVEAADRPGG